MRRIALIASLILVIGVLLYPATALAATWFQTLASVYLGGAPDYDNPQDVFVSGDYSYIADWDNLRIYDVSDPSNPTLVGRNTGSGGTPQNVVVVGDYAYVVPYQSTGLEIYNVSNKSSPYVTDSLPVSSFGGTTDEVAVSGNYAYVTSWTGTNHRLTVVEVSDKSNMVVRNYISLTQGLNGAGGLDVSGNWLYVACVDRLNAVDISDPLNPVMRSYASLAAHDVTVKGNRAYVVGGWTNQPDFRIVDVSNPLSMFILGSYDIPNPAQAYEVDVSGNYAYIAAGDAGLQVLDISHESNPTFVTSYSVDDAKGVLSHPIISFTWPMRGHRKPT